MRTSVRYAIVFVFFFVLEEEGPQSIEGSERSKPNLGSHFRAATRRTVPVSPFLAGI